MSCRGRIRRNSQPPARRGAAGPGARTPRFGIGVGTPALSWGSVIHERADTSLRCGRDRALPAASFSSRVHGSQVSSTCSRHGRPGGPGRTTATSTRSGSRRRGKRWRPSRGSLNVFLGGVLLGRSTAIAAAARSPAVGHSCPSCERHPACEPSRAVVTRRPWAICCRRSGHRLAIEPSTSALPGMLSGLREASSTAGSRPRS